MCNAVGLRQVWTVQPSGQTMRGLLTSAARSSWYFSVVLTEETQRGPECGGGSHSTGWAGSGPCLNPDGPCWRWQGTERDKRWHHASAVSLWCCEAGGPRRGSGASPLVAVRKRGWRSLLFSVSLFNQLLYTSCSTTIGFLFSLENLEAILKGIFWKVLQPTLSSPHVYFDIYMGCSCKWDVFCGPW